MFIALIVIVLPDTALWGQSMTFTSSGIFTVPGGVTSITVEAWGAGGGGSKITSQKRRGGGGGGGAYASSIIAVIPGNSYTIVVGRGGTSDNDGGNSTFNSTTVVAAGGNGAVHNSSNAGMGGSLANSTGTIRYAGGDGADGKEKDSGGGGGGAGSTGAGDDADKKTGGSGSSDNGGDGGDGVKDSKNGNKGFNYGGGGSGAVTKNSTDRDGGSGADGLVIISWTIAGGTWIGVTSTSWNTGSNWSDGIPSSQNDVTISAGGNQPIINTSALCRSIIIEPGAVLSILAGGTLTVSDNFSNLAGVSGLVLQSDETGTGSLIHNTDHVNATVNRQISGSSESWHLISTPVTDQTISGDWIPTGTYGKGTGYDLYVWSEENTCWIYKTDTASTINWNNVHPESFFVPGRGYLYSTQAANPVKQFIGNLNNGSQNIPLTMSGTDANIAGFTLVGNPYPSAIDWRASSGWSRSDLAISGTGYDMWIWNPAAINYGVINSAEGTGTNGVTRYLSPMQGFFVKAENAGSLGITNSVRAQSAGETWLKKSLSLEPNVESNKVDIFVKSRASAGFDEIQLLFGSLKNGNGAKKLFSPVISSPSLFLSSNEEDFSIMYLTDTIENPEVTVKFIPGTDGPYELSAVYGNNQFETFLLEDRKLKSFHDLKNNNTYSFYAREGDDPSRFILHFMDPELPGLAELPVNFYTNGAQLVVDMTMVSVESELTVFDLTGRKLLQASLHGETKHFFSPDSKPKILIVVLKNQNGKVCRKIIW